MNDNEPRYRVFTLQDLVSMDFSDPEIAKLSRSASAIKSYKAMLLKQRKLSPRLAKWLKSSG